MEEINKTDSTLLDYLRGLGFESEQLAADILRNTQLELPAFNAGHTIDFGEEHMSYHLHFVKEPQFKAYRLDKYTARYREAIAIKDAIIEGIDSAALDQLMARVHWPLFFKQGNVAGGDNNQLAKEAVNSLNILTGSKDPDAKLIGNQLMCKYWPKGQHTLEQKILFDNVYLRSRDFQANCDAITAYQVLSGRLDDIYEKIRVSGLDDLPGFDLYRRLEHTLKSNPASFTLETERNNAEGHTLFRLPATDNNGYYHVENYTAATTLYPAVEEGIYHGVDTRFLEKEMKGIDWSNDNKLFLFSDDREPELRPHINSIAAKMRVLWGHEDSIPTYDLLSLKYWQNVTFFEDFIREEGWKLLDNLPRNTMEFPAEVDYRAAINLLSGRPVMEQLLISDQEQSSDWIRLNLEKLGNKDAYPYIHIQGPSKAEMDIMLHQLPLVPNATTLYLPFLTRGELVPATLYNDKQVLLVANPEQYTLDVFSADGKQIPVNIHFDPDWKPPELQQGISVALTQNIEVKTHLKPKPPPPKTGKSKGL